MRLRANNLSELTNIVTAYLTVKVDCKILLRYKSLELMTIINTKLNEDKYIASITVDGSDKVYSIIINHKNIIHNDIYDFVIEYFEVFENRISEMIIDVIIQSNFNRSYYLNKVRDIGGSDLIKVENLSKLLRITKLLLSDENCDQIVVTFSIIIPDIEYVYLMDVIIDKFYTFGMKIAIVNIVRPDFRCAIQEPSIFNISNEECIDTTLDNLSEDYIQIFKRCMPCSSEEVDIYVRSNCELIKKNKGE